MKIGLLQCDSVREELQPKHGDYPAMFMDLFHKVDPSLEFAVYDVRRSEYPADAAECDAYITTGSRHGVNDGFDWIAELEGFVRELYRRHIKLVGICFGHQVIAKALGGEVVKSDKGWGVGVSRNRITQTTDWMSADQRNLNLVVSHQDQVQTLPPDSIILAESDFCPNYMFQTGDCFLSVQGHPEFSKAYSNDLMEARRDRIDAQTIDEGKESLGYPVDDLLMVQWIIAFLKA